MPDEDSIGGATFCSNSAGGTVLATKTDGTLWSWGYATQGQLGVNDRTFRSSPTQVPGTNWRSVHRTGRSGPGGMSMLATKTDNTLWKWGRNNNGQLGQNDTTQYTII